MKPLLGRNVGLNISSPLKARSIGCDLIPQAFNPRDISSNNRENVIFVFYFKAGNSEHGALIPFEMGRICTCRCATASPSAKLATKLCNLLGGIKTAGLNASGIKAPPVPQGWGWKVRS